MSKTHCKICKKPIILSKELKKAWEKQGKPGIAHRTCVDDIITE